MKIQKTILSLTAGILCLLLSCYCPIAAERANDVHLMPYLLLPAVIASVWGAKYAVLCIIGGMWAVPFGETPLFGMANFYTAGMYAVWLILLGLVCDMRRKEKAGFYTVYAFMTIFAVLYAVTSVPSIQLLAQLNPLISKTASFRFISENVISIHTNINILVIVLYTLAAQSLLHKNNYAVSAAAAAAAVLWYVLNSSDNGFSYFYISFDKYNLELSRIIRLLFGFDVIYFASDVFCGVYNHRIRIYELEQESRYRYINIFSSISDMYIEMSADGTVLEVSKAALNILGRSRNEVYGHNISEFFVYSHTAENILADIAGGRNLRDREVEIRKKDGSTASMLIAAAKRVSGEKIVFVARDITSYKKWEQEKTGYETRIKAVFDLCDELIWVVSGKEYTLMSFNRAAQEYFKKRFGTELTAGMSADEMFASDTPYWIEYYKDTERYGRYYSRYEDSVNDGVYEQCGFTMPKGDGSCDISMFMTDITETIKKSQYMELMNRELEHSVNERVRELASAYEELNSFSYTVSHELKTPIRAIQAHAQFIREDSSLDENALEELSEIERLCKGTFDMIVKLLEHTKLKSKQIQPSYVDMNKLVDEIAEEIKTTNKNKEIQFVRYALPSTVGDEFLLRQVIYNIFSNSVKFAKKNEAVVITAGSFSTEDENGFYFADRGVGFDMKYSDKLFHMFNRLHSDSEYEGSGIGLYTIKQIIEKHSGHVFIESEENKGCVVGFVLPK